LIEHKYIKSDVRIFYTLVFNYARVAVAFMTMLQIAKYLGPSEYGNYVYLLSTATAAISFINLDTYSAFYTYISSIRRGMIFYRLYSLWLFIQFVLLLVFAMLTFYIFPEKIWFNNNIITIILSVIASFSMHQLWRTAKQIGESIRDTRLVQLINLFITISIFIGIIILQSKDAFSINAVLFITSLINTSASIAYIAYAVNLELIDNNNPEDLKSILTDYYIYSKPLVALLLVSTITIYLDSWILQYYGSSVQQGYLSIGKRFSALVLVSTASIVQVLWKEVSELFNKNDIAQVATLYKKYLKGMFALSCFVAFFILPYSSEVVVFTVGEEYRGSIIPFAVMLLNPIQQTIGQINGLMFYAMASTVLLSRIGIITSLGSTLVNMVLVGYIYYYSGDMLTSSTMSIKIVCVGFVNANIMSYYIAKKLGIRYEWKYQLFYPLFFASISFPIKYLFDITMQVGPDLILLKLVISFACYSSVIIIFVLLRIKRLGLRISGIRNIKSILQKIM